MIKNELRPSISVQNVLRVLHFTAFRENVGHTLTFCSRETMPGIPSAFFFPDLGEELVGVTYTVGVSPRLRSGAPMGLGIAILPTIAAYYPRGFVGTSSTIQCPELVLPSRIKTPFVCMDARSCSMVLLTTDKTTDNCCAEINESFSINSFILSCLSVN